MRRVSRVSTAQRTSCARIGVCYAGKTRVLVAHIAHLVSTEHVPPRRVLALTFTNKASTVRRASIASIQP